jgi:type IV secretion system protein VirB3
MQDEGALQDDTLFLACTRPAMFLGVTMESMGVNVMFTTILFLLAGSIRYAVIGIAIHFIFRAIIWTDHNRFRVLLAWVDTAGRMRNGAQWGGSSLSPLSIGRRYTEEDFGHG